MFRLDHDGSVPRLIAPMAPDLDADTRARGIGLIYPPATMRSETQRDDGKRPIEAPARDPSRGDTRRRRDYLLYFLRLAIVGFFLGHRTNLYTWLGVLFSATGLYLLSITSGFRIEHGDLLVLCCAVVFTFHVLVIGWLSPRMNSFHLAAGHFAICALLNLIIAFSIESVDLGKIMEAAIPILYGGIISVGIAYTLQIIAQKEAHPAYASIILSLEAVFAVAGGWLILDEHLSGRMITGCVMMLSGMIVVQLKGSKSGS